MGGTERKKPQTLYDSDGMTFWKRQSCGDSQKTSGCQMPEERAGRVGRAQRSFRAVEILCVTLVQTLVCNTESGPSCSCGPWAQAHHF